MRAVWYTTQGSAQEVLCTGELDEPQAGPGEVRVRVHASGVNPVDVKRRTGGRGGMGSDLVVPHFDGAGLIDQVGDGVDASRIGQRVWFFEAQWGSDFGSAAEFVTVPASRAFSLPESASFAEGACLGIPALTAHRCLFADGPVDGLTVLITGGAGAVGHYAVQFANLAGARVIATASNAEKAAIASAAGAETVIDYRGEDVGARLLDITDGAGVDRIVEVEFGGNLEASLAGLGRNGVIATYASEAVPEPTVPFYQMLYRNITVRFELVFMMSDDAKLEAATDLERWMSDERLEHRIAARFPLEQTARAHEAVEAGPLGNIVIDVTP
jgi:NADPH2:quinone reductase